MYLKAAKCIIISMIFKLVTFVTPFLRRRFLPGPVAPNRAKLSENNDKTDPCIIPSLVCLTCVVMVVVLCLVRWNMWPSLLRYCL